MFLFHSKPKKSLYRKPPVRAVYRTPPAQSLLAVISSYIIKLFK